MKRFFVAGVLAVMALALGACASAPRASVEVSPQIPAYEPTGPIPMTVALAVDETAKVQSQGRTRVDDPYGPMIANDLRKMKLFGSVVYPYAGGSPAGQKAVLHLAITGGWHYSKVHYSDMDQWGMLPQGERAEGDHEVKITLTSNGQEIFSKTVPVESYLLYRGDDENRIAALLNRNQAGRIAIAVAKEIEARQAIIVAEVLNRPAYGAGAGAGAASAAGYVPAAPVSQASVPQPAVPGAGVPGAQMNTEEAGMGKKLSELGALHEQGVLSDADFYAARTRLMNIRKLDDLYRTGVITLPEYQKARAKIMEK